MKAAVLLRVIVGAMTLVTGAHSQVTYTATDISGNNWQYTYTLTNTLASGNIGELTVFYTLGSYSNLSVGSSTGNWSPLVAQPDASIPADGFFDVQATDAGLAKGASVGGFTVDFTWLGTGTPGSQVFNIVNPTDYSTVAAGTTTLAGAQAAPEMDAGSTAGAITLLLGSLIVLRARGAGARP